MALYSTAQLDLMESGNFQVVDLVQLTFWNSTSKAYADNYYFSTLAHDRLFNASVTTTYLGGLLLRLNSTSTASEMTRKNISFQLSGLSSTLVNYIKNSAHSGAPFTLSKALLDTDSQQVGNAVIVYKGTIQTGGLETTPTNSAIVLNGSHSLYDFTRTNNVKSNRDDYIGWCKRNNITGYANEFANIDDTIDINWGKA